MWTVQRTPIGAIRLRVENGHLTGLHFQDDVRGVAPEPCFAEAIDRYFCGELDALDALPIAPVGTEFQRRVWTALRRIPPGATTSYGELARGIGHPTAVRAVARANAQNPVGLVVPCHRVIGSD